MWFNRHADVHEKSRSVPVHYACNRAVIEWAPPECVFDQCGVRPVGSG